VVERSSEEVGKNSEDVKAHDGMAGESFAV